MTVKKEFEDVFLLLSIKFVFLSLSIKFGGTSLFHTNVEVPLPIWSILEVFVKHRRKSNIKETFTSHLKARVVGFF